MPEFVLEVFYFDYSHLSQEFQTWDALSEYVSKEVKFVDVFTLSIRAY